MARRTSRGITLLEVLVSISILALISALVYGAFAEMTQSKQALAQINERYHHGRGALARISRELQSAFISAHDPIMPNMVTRKTLFVGKDSRPVDRVDFTSFSHRRLSLNAHESDQNEISYFGSRDPEKDKLDLARREDKSVDLEPERGGVVNVIAEDIESLELRYFDPLTKDWTDTWDSTQPAAQFGRLPLYVEVTLVIKGRPGEKPITFQTKVPIAMQAPLAFAK